MMHIVRELSLLLCFVSDIVAESSSVIGKQRTTHFQMNEYSLLNTKYEHWLLSWTVTMTTHSN